MDLNLSTLETPNRRSQITQTLRAAVLAGEMKVGEIYSAPMLATQFGVSATPVREAMIDLAKEGIVEVVRNKGFRVAQPSIQELQQMMEVRLLLEVPTIRGIAARGLTADQRSAAQHLAEASLESAQRNDLIAHVAADIRFHLYLLSLSGNEELVDIIRVLRSRSRPYGLQSEKKRAFLLESAQEHLTLVRLIINKQPVQASELIDSHIRRAGQEWSDPNSEIDLG
ncbi:GntR family transcriptional regulator [Ensifer sp. Root127]|uniref:GntR family transcriptional regulator n=1 Tax=Ensifer sp. Root127 TaxID=1736440 RepID=UPI0019101870|nr:GntR family transcriptional regulator [Ensifer sp. Root127]